MELPLTSTTSPADALRCAVDEVGSQAAFARLIGVAQPSVWKWLRDRKPLPPKHVLKVEARTGISRHDLNPDVYPRETAADASTGSMEPVR